MSEIIKACVVAIYLTSEAMVTVSIAQLRRIVYKVDSNWYASHIHGKMINILADISPDIDLLRGKK